MSGEFAGQQGPEEAELHRKHEERAGVRGALSERELELTYLRALLGQLRGQRRWELPPHGAQVCALATHRRRIVIAKQPIRFMPRQEPLRLALFPWDLKGRNA